MSSSSIDTLLKIAAATAKPAALTTKPAAQSGPRDSADEFDSYLRQAASSNCAPEKPRGKEQSPASDKPLDKQVAASGQEQGATASPDDESAETPAVEQTEETTEGQAETTPTDEVLLSVAASALAPAAPTEVITAVDVAVGEFLVEPVPIESPVEPAEGKKLPPAIPLLPEFETGAAAVDGLPAGAAANATAGGDELAKEAAVEATEIIETVAEQVATKPPAELGQAPTAQQVSSAQQVISKEKTETKKNEQGEQAQAKAGDAEKAPAFETNLDIPHAVVAESAELATASDPTGEPKAKTTLDAPAPAPSVNTQVNSQPITQAIPSQSEVLTTRGESDPQTPTIDRARFVQRVANAFRSAQQNDGQIQLRLSPPELGSLRIEIAVRNGVLSANLEAETADARRVLLDNLPALRQRLAEQDIRIEKFDVDIRRDGGQQEGQANAREQQSDQQSSRATAQNRIRAPQTTDVHATRMPRNPLTGTDAGLDVRI